MDNGAPWGTNSPVPSALALWLAGLGVTPVYGRPARCTDNAIVERDHGVLAQWVELETCPDFETCRQRLQWATTTQRQRYRAPNGYTRLQAYPELESNPRSYLPQQDQEIWRLEDAALYLSGFTFRRKVEASGQITLFANSYSLGRSLARHSVLIKMDRQTREWVVTDDYNRPLRRLPAKELNYEQICQFRLAKRRRN